MAAISPRRIHPPVSTSYQYDRLSPRPSCTVRIRRRSRDVIPNGAVASRVKLLQSLREPQPTRPVSPAPKRTREDSRSGFGRRVSRRFGNPAIQSAQPDETPRVESRHSFLGLNPVRTNHEEEHALTDQVVQYTRSPGRNGQSEREIDARKQYDAAYPWGALPRTKSIPRASRCDYSTDIDALQEIDWSGNHRQLTAQSSRFPSIGKKDNAGMYSHKVPPYRPKFIDSEASIATSSTIRRQNVRDLFRDYGIQRPAGLASREVSQDMGESTHMSNTRTFCHVCSWSNSRTSIKCMRCSHQFCTQCKEHPSQLPPTQEEETLDHVEMSTKHWQGYHKAIPKPKENRVEHNPVKKHRARPDPTPLQSRKGTQKPSSPPIKFPDFYDPPNPQRSPRKISPVQVSRQDPKPVHFLRGRKTTTSVKDSPFVIADLKSPSQSLRLLPSGGLGETYQTAHNHHNHHSKHHRRVNYASTVPSGSLICDNATCCETHHRHQPFHHASACPRKKPKQRVPEDTENGYIADTSRVDDAVYFPSRCNFPSSKPDPRLAQQMALGYSRLTSSSGPDSCSSHVMKTDYSAHDIPEYVDCRGYPRTGHARHGSPVSSGVVGECQHCLDDCQCAACQNTHHSVRCCVHTDHQTIVHHHHTPRKVVAIECSEEHVPLKAGNPPSRAHEQPVQVHSSNGQHELETHVKEYEKSHKPACSKEKPKQPKLASPVSKPPAEIVTTHRDTNDKKATNLEQNEEIVSQFVRPRSKESTPTVQRAPQEHSSFEASAQPTDGTWLTIPSPHEHDHIHERRNSCPPSRKNSLGIQNHEIKMTGAISPRTHNQTTPPDFEKATCKLSSTLKQTDRPPVENLKQQLLSNQEGLQKIQQDCTTLSAPNGVAELAQRIEQKAKKGLDDPYRVTRTPSICSRGSTGSKKKNWKLKLVDWNPEGRKKGGEEHRLSDDEVLSDKERESYKAMPSVSTATSGWMDFSQGGESERKNKGEEEDNVFKRIKVSGKEHNLSVDEVVMEDLVMEHEHDCVWKKRFEDVCTSKTVRTEIEKKDLGILGITILVHLAERKDLVAEIKSWTGGELIADTRSFGS
ncbi:hypothetical protein BKA64DRAFT_700648 [Cadophora sp. MPI-SDFR-AT-0126]|nr:hypothetical protein BKA64DRAFT_700648 [Leotiomycetes sp. MPI-SDFR-AT-0126]